MLGYKKLLYSKLTNSFQDGVDTLYNKCKSCGSTPSSKTPTAISTAIQKLVETPYTKCKDCGATPTAKTNSAIVTAIGKIYTDRYNAGKTAGTTDGQKLGRSFKLTIVSRISCTNHGNGAGYFTVTTVTTYQNGVDKGTTVSAPHAGGYTATEHTYSLLSATIEWL